MARIAFQTRIIKMPLRLALSTKGRFYVRIFGRKQILISGPDLSQTFIAAKIVCKIYSIPFIVLPIAKVNILRLKQAQKLHSNALLSVILPSTITII